MSCGAPAPAESPSAAPNEPASATPAPTASAAPAVAQPTEPPPSEAAPASAAQGDPSAQAPPEPDTTRDVRYIQTPEGLRVEVLGARFIAQAKPVRTQAGFVVKVSVSATAGESRSLLSPKNGPLAFAGAVKRSGKSEPEQFGDERKGDGEQIIGTTTPTKFEREWPGKGVRPLGNGDTLELDVGLWGLGHTAADRRAVKQFARVKVKVTDWKASARVEPPPAVTGK